MNRNNTIMWAVCLLLVLGCNSAENTEKNTEEQSRAETAGTSQTIELVDLDGNSIDLSQYKGKKIFLNFWATWCGPCIKEMPSIERAQRVLNQEDYVFLLASDEALKRIQSFATKKEMALNFVQLKTPLSNLKIHSLPVTFIMNSEGDILKRIEDAREWDELENLELLKSL